MGMLKAYRGLIALFVGAALCSPYPALALPGDVSGPPLELPQLEKTIPPYDSGIPDQSGTDAAPVQQPIQPESSGEQVPSLFTYGKKFFPDIAGGTERIFSSDNIPVALVGTVLTGLAASVDHLDRNTKVYFQTRRPLDGVSKYGDTIGQGYYHIGIGAGLLTAGELLDNRKLADTGIVTLEAWLVNGIATEGLKYATHRLRPNGGDHMSFPSGHSSSTAVVAASISAMYDWDLRVTIPLYATAVFVGASRIQDNMHYLSDVLAGLTIGTVVGTSFANYHKEKDKTKTIFSNLSISPVLEKDLKGTIITFRW